MKIYDEDRWDEDDACVECGEPLIRESKVLGLCQDCYLQMAKGGPSVDNESTFGGPSITVHPPKK